MPEFKAPEIPEVYKRHARWKAWSGTVVVGLSTAPTSILSWDTMLVSGKLVALSGILIAMIKAYDMFYDQTMSRVAAGKLPVKLDGQNGFDTTHMTKTETIETSTPTAPKP